MTAPSLAKPEVKSRRMTVTVLCADGDLAEEVTGKPDTLIGAHLAGTGHRRFTTVETRKCEWVFPEVPLPHGGQPEDLSRPGIGTQGDEPAAGHTDWPKLNPGPGQPDPGADSHMRTGASAPGWLGASGVESPPSPGQWPRPDLSDHAPGSDGDERREGPGLTSTEDLRGRDVTADGDHPGPTPAGPSEDRATQPELPGSGPVERGEAGAAAPGGSAGPGHPDLPRRGTARSGPMFDPLSKEPEAVPGSSEGTTAPGQHHDTQEGSDAQAPAHPHPAIHPDPGGPRGPGQQAQGVPARPPASAWLGAWREHRAGSHPYQPVQPESGRGRDETRVAAGGVQEGRPAGQGGELDAVPVQARQGLTAPGGAPDGLRPSDGQRHDAGAVRDRATVRPDEQRAVGPAGVQAVQPGGRWQRFLTWLLPAHGKHQGRPLTDRELDDVLDAVRGELAALAASKTPTRGDDQGWVSGHRGLDDPAGGHSLQSDSLSPRHDGETPARATARGAIVVNERTAAALEDMGWQEGRDFLVTPDLPLEDRCSDTQPDPYIDAMAAGHASEYPGEDYEADWDRRCSDPPEESCADAGCPVHGWDARVCLPCGNDQHARCDGRPCDCPCRADQLTIDATDAMDALADEWPATRRAMAEHFGSDQSLWDDTDAPGPAWRWWLVRLRDLLQDWRDRLAGWLLRDRDDDGEPDELGLFATMKASPECWDGDCDECSDPDGCDCGHHLVPPPFPEEPDSLDMLAAAWQPPFSDATQPLAISASMLPLPPPGLPDRPRDWTPRPVPPGFWSPPAPAPDWLDELLGRVRAATWVDGVGLLGLGDVLGPEAA